MRVFLDSNVVLTGAFNPQGPAGTLRALLGSASFVYSPQVLAECDYLIRRDAPSGLVAQVAAHLLRSYLVALGALQIPDASPPAGVRALDTDDDMLLGAALASKCDAICTYNVKDFPARHITVGTPLALHRSVAEPQLEHYVQAVHLSNRGTILFCGRLHHQGSMGTILESGNDLIVEADEKGFIKLTGSAVKESKSITPLSGGALFRLTVRYNLTYFEAALWKNSSKGWSHEIISKGKATFSQDTKPVLCFVPNHRFSASIRCISGLPRYVRDKQMPPALDNFSLEAVAGSLDLKRYLNAVHLQY